MKTKKSFDSIPSYKQFVNDRDEVLEKIFRNFRLKNTDLIDATFTNGLQIIHNHYNSLLANPFDRAKFQSVQDDVERVFEQTSRDLAWSQIRLRAISYMLASAGESEAVARILKKPAALKLDHNTLANKAYGKLSDGTDLYERILFSFHQVLNKWMSALRFSIMMGEPIENMMGRLILTLPKKKILSSSQRALKKVKRAKIAEATKPKFYDGEEDPEGITVSVGPRGGTNIKTLDWDNATWDEVIKQSNDEYDMIDRSPANFFDATNPTNLQPIREEIPEEDRVYGWELEQQMTHDFVKSVREGQIDAANIAGITEFIWIAILDQKTCEFCCEWRSGLMTSEIEKKLAEDKELADHCDVIVPPAHFNCRCTIAPVAGDVAELTTTSDINTKGFDEWLNSE